MEWFRFYHEALDDLKVQSLPPATFKHWVNLLCLANLSTPRGTLPDIAVIAYRLRVSPAKARALIDEFVDRGLLDRDDVTLQPHNWNGRQRVSDDVAKRVAKHRGNVTGNVTGNADVTVTRDRTDTESDTESEQRTPPVSPSPGEPKPKAVRSVKTPVPENIIELIPIDTWRAIGAEQKLTDEQLRYESALMVDHYRGKGERRPDWVATWRNWMRSEYRQSKPLQLGPNGMPPEIARLPYNNADRLRWEQARRDGVA